MTARLIILLGTNHRALRAAVDSHAATTSFSFEPWPEIGSFHTGGTPRHPSELGDVADAMLAASLEGPIVTVTHSDVFVLRIRRRIAEGTLSPSDVALVWIEADGTEKPIGLNDRGTPYWWPKGIGAESLDEFHAIRRALADRDWKAAETRAELPTIPPEEATES